MTKPNGEVLVTQPIPQDEGSQVMALFQMALAKDGGSVEALGKLVDLHDRVSRRRAELEFSVALVAFQSECPPVPRSSEAKIVTKSGGSFSYAYADLEQVIETVRPHLNANGLSFTFDSETDGKVLKCICVLRHANGHSITSSFTLPTDSTSAMSEQQKVGAALTFAKRQALAAVLGLSLTDDAPAGEHPSANVFISTEQTADINALLEETGSDLDKFLRHFGVQKVSELRQGQCSEAMRMLEKKRKGAGK